MPQTFQLLIPVIIVVIYNSSLKIMLTYYWFQKHNQNSLKWDSATEKASTDQELEIDSH